MASQTNLMTPRRQSTHQQSESLWASPISEAIMSGQVPTRPTHSEFQPLSVCLPKMSSIPWEAVWRRKLKLLKCIRRPMETSDPVSRERETTTGMQIPGLPMAQAILWPIPSGMASRDSLLALPSRSSQRESRKVSQRR